MTVTRTMWDSKMTYTSEIAVKLIDSMGGDSSIVAAARVSTRGTTAAEVSEHEQQGLINYLMKMKHGTPFEHSSLTFFVHAPIFVWREWHRHRIGFSYNEESARYKQLDPVFYIPPCDRPMMKVDDWKPGRPKFTECEDSPKYDALCARLKQSYAFAYSVYEENLRNGFDPGIARACLPVGIYSSCYVTCNPRSLMAFLSLRIHHDDSMFVSYPLYEIEEAAKACEKLFSEGWPLTHKAFCDNRRVGP